jgi:uncharacterized protein
MLTALAGAAGLISGAIWYYTNQIRREGLLPGAPIHYHLDVGRVGKGLVELRPARGGHRNGDWMEPGLWGLLTPNGYGRVRDIMSKGRNHVVRAYEPVTGAARPGDAARLDVFAHSGDPKSALDIDFTEVLVPSKLWRFPAWQVPGSASTWVVFVHGKGGRREEALRFIPKVRELSFPSLTISYRNDAGVPRDPSGYYQYGLTEWADLEAAVAFARANGARRVVLYGFSMGGSIILSFLLNSSLRDIVAGAVLDSPLIALRSAVDHGAAKRYLVPRLMSELAQRVATVRFGLDWDALDYLSRSGELQTPLLLLHSERDHMVPVGPSDQLARLRPDIVTYHRFSFGGHTRIWNADPGPYEAALEGFLTRL